MPQFALLVYIDPTLLDALPAGEGDAMMRYCLDHADEMKRDGQLLGSVMLKQAPTAKTLRVRQGKATTYDGPFAEAKEVLGGLNLIEAKDIDEAIEIAATFPWARTGSIEVRELEDVPAVRRRVFATQTVA